ncbi:hypothetical protein V2O64_24520 (plasmid) [Verrucomicrobiaceae bacterium 227]
MTSLEFEEMIPLAALGKLTRQEQTSFETAMADNPDLATALREHEEIVAGLWQSASPLRTMPHSVWNEIKSEINPPSPVQFSAPGVSSWLGWAAALMVAAIWFLMSQNTPDEANPAVGSQALPLGENTAKPDRSSRVVTSRPDSSRQRQLFDLREKLRTIRDADAASTASPRIVALRHPDSPILDDPETRTQRLMDLLTMALHDDLQRINEEKVTLVIEEGWPEAGLNLPREAVVRHRNFPVEQAEMLGLLVSEENHFYDPASSMLWMPAPDGGGFLGERAPEDLDLTQFQHPLEPEPQTMETQIANLGVPEGYLISAGQAGESPTFILNNVNLASDSFSVLQGGTVIPLKANSTSHFQGSLADASVWPRDGLAVPDDPASTIGWMSDNYVGSTIFVFDPTSFEPGPPFKADVPFEVIKTSATGEESVILTNAP